MLVILAFFPGSLAIISDMLGIQYPPATLFFLSTLVTIVLLFRQFGKISVLTIKVNELVRTVGILTNEIEKLKQEQGSE